MQYLSWTLHFLLELAALAALATWGIRTGPNIGLKILLGVGVPILAAAAWGIFRVNNDPGPATVVIPGPLRLLLELAVFGGAVAGLAAAGLPNLALWFGVLALVDYAWMYQRILWLLRQ